jgi:thiamine biosynthesis lipoprotein
MASLVDATPASANATLDIAARRGAGATWQALGTKIVVRAADPRALPAARLAVTDELAAVDRACSRFRDDSELSRANSSGGRAIQVGPLLLEAVEQALRAAEATDGDVDPTVGRALELAGYDRDWQLLEPASGTCEEPPALTIRSHSGWRTVAVDRERSSVRLPAGVKLDLGATGKAWAADRCAAAAAAAGKCGALVAVGGDVAVAGEPPARGWRVHVTDDHRSHPSAPGQTVHVESGGLATSSTAVRRWRHRGRTNHHIIDPRTGAPARECWRTVSVAAASCLDANAACTAAIVRGACAPRWLAQLGLPARLVAPDGSITFVGGWPREAGS